jgi:hypothetical protein
MFFVIVGPSGKCRKGTSMDIIASFMFKASIHMAPESTTREALIKHLETCRESFLWPEMNETIFHCSMHIFSKEFGVFISKEKHQMIEDLCDLYDSGERWTYQTKNSGTNYIENVCVNLLAATTPSWLQSSMPSDAIGHGLCSRIIFVVAEQKQKLVPFPFLSDDQKEMQPQLEHDLGQICLLTGRFTMDKPTMELYERWYRESEADPPFEHPKFEGYVARRPTHLRKLCMISSASRGDSKLIDTTDFFRALDIMKRFEKPMTRAFGAHGRSRLAATQDDILRYIAKNLRATRSDIVRRFSYDADVVDLDKILLALKQMKSIETTVESGELIYTYKEDAHE